MGVRDDSTGRRGVREIWADMDNKKGREPQGERRICIHGTVAREEETEEGEMGGGERQERYAGRVHVEAWEQAAEGARVQSG